MKKNRNKKTTIPQTKEVGPPIASKKVAKLKLPQKDKIENVKEKKLKIDPPQKIKTEQKEIKKSIKPNTNKTKKEKKKNSVKDKKQESIFSKLPKHSNVESISKAHLADNDIAIIREQISRYWIKTPCPDNVNVELEIVVNANCDIISRNIDMRKYTHSSQIMACANSALRATQQCEKLDLDIKKCQQLSNKLIILNFNTQP